MEQHKDLKRDFTFILHNGIGQAIWKSRNQEEYGIFVYINKGIISSYQIMCKLLKNLM